MINAKYNSAHLFSPNGSRENAGRFGNTQAAAAHLQVSATTLSKVIKELRAASQFCRRGEEEVYWFEYQFTNGARLSWVNPEVKRQELSDHAIRVTHNTKRRKIMLATTNGRLNLPNARPKDSQMMLAF